MLRLTKVLAPLVAIGCLATLSPAPAAGATPAPLAVPVATRTIVVKEPSKLNNRWHRVAAIGYGSARAKLGTSPGGDGSGLNWGPSYGTQVPNGTWWYADSAKKRLAHYSAKGHYLGQVKLPARYLKQGTYFQWQNPQPLADGTVVLTSTTIGAPGLLLLSPNGKLKRVRLSRFVAVAISDGSRLYGFDENRNKVRVMPRTGAIKKVARFVGQGGRSFTVSINPGYLRIVRPGVNLRVNLNAAGLPGLTVHPSIQVAMGASGKLWILVNGLVEASSNDLRTVVGLFNVNSSGRLSAVSALRDPSSPADPGDGHSLGIRHGGSRPWLMFIDEAAVRVFSKE